MASSSGCAINRQIRLLVNRGNDRAKGDELVEDMVQKTSMAGSMKASVTNVEADMVN